MSSGVLEMFCILIGIVVIWSNTYVKTLRINEDGTMNEDISFSAFEFSDLIEETWEESQVFITLQESKR